MADGHQRTRVRLGCRRASNPRDRRTAAEPLTLDSSSSAPLNQNIVERESAVRVGFDGGLFRGEPAGRGAGIVNFRD